MTTVFPVRDYFYRLLRFVGTRNWVRWGLRYRLFCLLKPVNYAFEVPFFGLIYRGNFNDIVDRRVYFYGAHEREAMLYMGSRIPSDGVVLDIGANVGHHSLFFATKAKEIHAFEPNPEFHEQFNAHMRSNKITNVFLHKFGLGNITQNAPYYAGTGDIRGVGSFVANSHRASGKNIGLLPILRGDDAVASLGVKRIDFIKIDVERYEEQVLLGLQETLRKFKPVIILEYDSKDFPSHEQFVSLISGYVPYLLQVNRPRFFLFNNPACVAIPLKRGSSKGEVLLLPESPRSTAR